MNQQDLVAFNLAVIQAQIGEKEAAYNQLKALLKKGKENQQDPNLLLWFAFTSPDLEESKMALDIVTLLDPNNSDLPAAREWFIREQQQRKFMANEF
jgi:hypothetical protein